MLKLKIQTRGRRPKTGERKPCGRLKDLTPLDRQRQHEVERKRIEQIERDRRLEDLALIASQPHRAGDPTDSRRESPLGRFVAANKLRPEIHGGVDAFGDLARRWRLHKGIPSDVRPPSNGGGTGEGPSGEEVAKWGRRVARVRRTVLAVLTTSHPGGYLDEDGKEVFLARSDAEAVRIYELIRAMVVDGRDMLVLNPQPVIVAMRTIAVEMGALDGRDQPFARQAA